MSFPFVIPTGLLAVVLLAACGGTTVVETAGDGGGSVASTGAAPSATDGASSGDTVSGSGPTTGAGAGGPCDEHADCGDGVCAFASGTCLPGCGEEGTCGPGSICDDCASSSCPKCNDCLGGCVAAPPHSCDTHDDCGAAESCVFSTGGCQPRCDADGGCPEGFVCDDCATSSCPGCRDCEPACVPDPGGCTSHEECAPDLCVFAGGYCTAACEPGRDCGSKAYCDDCVTSSCPGCADCVGGCVYLP